MFEKDCDVNRNRVQRIAPNSVNNPVIAKNRNNVFTPLTPTNPVNKLTNDVTRVATVVFGCRPHKAGAIAHHQQSPRPKPAYRTPTESPSKHAFPNKRVRQHALFAPSSGRFCFQRLPESAGSARNAFWAGTGNVRKGRLPTRRGLLERSFCRYMQLCGECYLCSHLRRCDAVSCHRGIAQRRLFASTAFFFFLFLKKSRLRTW